MELSFAVLECSRYIALPDPAMCWTARGSGFRLFSNTQGESKSQRAGNTVVVVVVVVCCPDRRLNHFDVFLWGLRKLGSS